MKEAGELLEECAGAGTCGLPAVYAGGMLERGETTVGGPAVETEGLEGLGEED
jgi:hypothetical protein